MHNGPLPDYNSRPMLLSDAQNLCHLETMSATPTFCGDLARWLKLQKQSCAPCTHTHTHSPSTFLLLSPAFTADAFTGHFETRL